jgi:hypothetical protein
MDYAAFITEVNDIFHLIQTIPGETKASFEVDVPMSFEELTAIRNRWKIQIPESLEDFWTHCSRSMFFQYIWNPPPEKIQDLFGLLGVYTLYGGPQFTPARLVEPPYSRKFTLLSDGEMSIEQRKNSVELWSRCIRFTHNGDGSALGLDYEDGDRDDPPVVYLVPGEIPSFKLSPTFSEFLEVWKKLYFMGPEWRFLYHFYDEVEGKLVARQNKVSDIRCLLENRVRRENEMNGE